jgi:hypothetical protein
MELAFESMAILNFCKVGCHVSMRAVLTFGSGFCPKIFWSSQTLKLVAIFADRRPIFAILRLDCAMQKPEALL